MPCGKVLACLCPVASVIRRGRLISQSELHGGNADRLNKQPVLGSRGSGRLAMWRSRGQHVPGQEKGKRALSKEPFTCWSLQPELQRLFSSNVTEALPSTRPCACCLRHPCLWKGSGWWGRAADGKRHRALQGVHNIPSSWNVSSLSKEVWGREAQWIAKQAWID